MPAFAELLPFLREGSAAAVGEALYSLTFAHEADHRVVPLAGARPWSEAEAAAFLEALRLPGRAHGHSVPHEDVIVDVVRMIGGRRAVCFLVWQEEHLARAIFSEDPEQSHQWAPVDEDLLRPWLAARRAALGEGGTSPARRDAGAHPLKAAIAATRGAVGLTGRGVTGALSAVGHFQHEPYWQAEMTVAAMMALSLALHKRFQVGPAWLMAVLEGLLLLALLTHDPRHPERARSLPRERLLPRLALGVVTLANTVSLFVLVHELLTGSSAGGHALILSAVVIWLTNVGIFALAFWELDRGGPDNRVLSVTDEPASFLFPQMTLGGRGAQSWRPSFVDYLYTSFTNATAFSPTDTMPLGPRAKVLMLIQSLASLVTVGLVAARAVNILK